MADLALRQLDRAARAGDPEAEVRALRERLRRGEVTREQVELLAYCGDRISRRVTAEQPWELCDSAPPEVWARGLAPLLVAALDREALVRVLREVRQADGGPKASVESWLVWVAVGRLYDCLEQSVRACVSSDGIRLGPRLRPVVLAAVRREVWGG